MLPHLDILVLEDEVFFRKSIVSFLEESGYTAWPASTIAEARSIIQGQELDFAILDLNLPDGNSIDLLKEKPFSNNTSIIAMTAEGGIDSAVQAMRLGAKDYLSKPFEPEELPVVFNRLNRESAAKRIQNFQREKEASSTEQSLFFGERLSVIQSQLNKIIEAESRLQKHFPPVLIEGETGTGKSSLARYLHRSGPRSEAAFVEVNCSTLPESLAESELFGHEKGAFTDARKDRIGLFEAASGGTLFLDEISSLPIQLQAKVLTAIEDQKIRRVGSTRQIAVDVRLLAASLHPLKNLVEEKTFREDLFHRLNLLHITIPPIRDFKKDLPQLAEHLLDSLKIRYRMPRLKLSAKANSSLVNYAWPGNVRELAHELERGLIFCDGISLDLNIIENTINADSVELKSLINPHFEIPEEGFSLEMELKAASEILIQNALNSCNGNISAAARLLGVPRDYIRYRLPKD